MAEQQTEEKKTLYHTHSDTVKTAIVLDTLPITNCVWVNLI